jgi:predicted transposase/invertase (TIGR01784 family)
MSFGEQWRWEMLKRQVRKMDEKAEKEQIRLDIEEARTKALAEGHAEGHAEGKAEGLEKGKLEIAGKMKALGRPLSEITEITGLSPEVIEKL